MGRDHRRGGFGRLRAGRAARRGRPGIDPGDRGRAARSQPLGPSADRLRQDLLPSPHELDVPDHAASRAGRAGDLPAARQGRRRIERDQRDGLCPRPGRGFRRMEAARQSRLGLGRGARRLQAHGGPRAGCLRLARRRRSAPCRKRRRRGSSADAAFRQGGRRSGPALQPGPQRRDQRGRRLLPDHHARRPT